MARKSVKKRSGKKTKDDKSSAGKWFLIIFLLLLFTAIGAGAYLYFTGQVDQYLDDKNFFEQSSDEILDPLPDELKQPDILLDKIVVEPPPVKKVKAPVKKRSARYLLKLGDCLYKECINQYAKAIRKAGQRIYKKKITRKTKYYELLSKEKFSYDRMIEKIKLIDNYKNVVGAAYPIKSNNGYYISFGQYPDPDIANKTLAYIDQFNFDVNVQFRIIPRNSTYKATSVYAGPYTTKKSANYAKKQLKNLEEIKDIVLTKR